jgi:hypothetical protein
MSSTQPVYHFLEKVCNYDFGKYYYTVVFLLSELVEKLPFDKYPRLRTCLKSIEKYSVLRILCPIPLI